MATIQHIFIFLTIIAIANTAFVCPGYGYVFAQQPCINTCSPTNDTCSGGKKCCYTPLTPCGYRCLDAKNDTPKSGICPPTSTPQKNPNWYLCDAHFCDVDKDCPCKEKCCPNACGTKLCIAV